MSRGFFGSRGFRPSGILSGGILSGGILTGGFCPVTCWGHFVRGDFVLSPVGSADTKASSIHFTKCLNTCISNEIHP